MTSSNLGVEVTDDDFQRVTTGGSSSSLDSNKSGRNLTSRLNNLFHKHKATSNVSVSSDRATTDSGSITGLATVGGESVSNNTFASIDTVKMSNRRVKPPLNSHQHNRGGGDVKKNPWRKLKKMMSAKNKDCELDEGVDHASSTTASLNRSRSMSSPSMRPEVDGSFPIRKRIESESRVARGDNTAHGLDDAIRGRLDGMDMLSLGSARRSSTPRASDALTQHLEPLRARDIVTDMLWTCAGRDPPEIVLESFIPNDRWLVRMESTATGSEHVMPHLQPTDDEDSLDGSPQMSTPKLLASMWGTDSTVPPSHAPPVEGEDPDLFQMAASCSVPIDIDEETFIIDTAAHLQAVHDIATVPLRRGRFEDCLEIFLKILKGLETKSDTPRHMIALTLHNIGVLQQWLGRFQEASETFHRAVSIRTQVLSPDHPDVAVSLGREATSLFALEQYSDALAVLEKSLQVTFSGNATRAKILNNIGVVHYQRRDSVEAMKAFASALEIQRAWLDGKIRRESIVFDASTTMVNMGKLYLEQENYEMSFFVYEEALLLQTTAFPKDHDIVIRSLDSIAYARAKQGEWKKALDLYESILRSQNTHFGPTSKESMETTMIMGILSTRLNSYDDALRHFTTVLKWQKAQLSSSDPALLQTKEYIHKIESNLDGEVSVWV